MEHRTQLHFVVIIQWGGLNEFKIYCLFYHHNMHQVNRAVRFSSYQGFVTLRP